MVEKKNNKLNRILTSIILAVAFLIAVVMGYEFLAFKNFCVWFYVGNTDEIAGIERFSLYSATLEGTEGDSFIYKQTGSKNTVALVRKAELAEYATAEQIDRAHAVCEQSQWSVVDRSALNLDEGNVSLLSAAEISDGLRSGSVAVALMSYADAVSAVKESRTDGAEGTETLAISPAVVERTPSLLVLGGTHPNEPSGQLTATLLLENAKMERGTLYVITETNRSAYTASQPQEATTWYYGLQTASGQERTFKFGARATNTVDQWPTPDMYEHISGEQSLSGSESRNVNRAYPGAADGTYTERIAYAVTQLIKQNDITMVIDLHEAAPEYITINAMVYHQDAGSLASYAKLWGFETYYAITQEGEEIDGVQISSEVSPLKMHGLTHRELGDYTNAYAFLFETSNASQGKLRGEFTKDLITYSQPDRFYEYAKTLEGLLYAPPVPLSERVARHTLAVECVIDAFNQEKTSRNTMSEQSCNRLLPEEKQEGQYLGAFRCNALPEYVDVLNNGVGYYLHDPI